MSLDDWIINGDIGISSKTMWAALKGLDIRPEYGNKPYDPDDFSRCYKLVKQCNITEQDLQKISRILPYWKPYIDNWHKLTKMYEQNNKDNWINSKKIGMYEFMQELSAESDLTERH